MGSQHVEGATSMGEMAARFDEADRGGGDVGMRLACDAGSFRRRRSIWSRGWTVVWTAGCALAWDAASRW